MDVLEGMASTGVEIIETLPIKRNIPTVIMGFAGPGFIGNSAVMYIVRIRGFRQRAFLRSSLIPPMMLIIEGRPASAFRIYSSEDESLLLMASEILFASENAWPVSVKLMDWLANKGAREFVSIEGMPFTARTQERIIFGFSTSRDLTPFGVQPTQEGAISGIGASMLDECVRRGLSWTSIFVPTNLLSAVDYGGAAAAIETLNRMFRFGVDVSQLKQRDEMIRQIAGRQRPPSRGISGLFRKRQ